MKQDLERIKKLMKGEGYRNEGCNDTNINGKVQSYSDTKMLHWILLSYVYHYVLQCISSSLPKPLSPHELIQVTWELVCVASPHTLQFGFHTAPVTLNVLSMHSCHRLYKVEGVIYHTM